MLGAIAGDIVGSVFEGSGRKETDFPLFSSRSTFTDDTVLTIAVAAVLLEGGDYASALRRYGRRYPHRGYGASFHEWLYDDSLGAYNSWGNGSAMRVSPVGFSAKTIDEVLSEAQRSAAVTHNHPEGVRGAQATALAIFLARHGASKSELRRELSERFGYDLGRVVDEIRPGYAFDVSCQGSVPESIICFLDSPNLEGAIRLAVSLGGDADTMACIAGGIAEAFYGGVPDVIEAEVRNRLPEDLFDIVDRFRARFFEHQ
ncbi:MAG: ADP-ribosylglycohydrolase family protein [Gammaproteobacteria bacterium]|jgi:ADP-ribosylglycohydrolase|nr:ADP-ribosylglycohydrolase family protein [Gammaproteobacteria bacterium]